MFAHKEVSWLILLNIFLHSRVVYIHATDSESQRNCYCCVCYSRPCEPKKAVKLKCAFSSFSYCCWRQLNCVTVCKSLLKKIRQNIGNSPTGMCQSKLKVFLFSSWNNDIQSCSFITMDARFACAQYRTVCSSN